MSDPGGIGLLDWVVLAAGVALTAAALTALTRIVLGLVSGRGSNNQLPGTDPTRRHD